MCLIASKTNTKRFASLMKSRGGKFIGWKRLRVNTLSKELTSIVYSNYEWDYGWNKSDRDNSLYLNEKHYNEFDHGIHIFKRRPYKNQWSVVVPVVCYLKDFVASNNKQAVFSKVFLRKKDYLKAIGKNKNV